MAKLIRERDGLLWFAPPAGTELPTGGQLDPWTRARQAEQQRKYAGTFAAGMANMFGQQHAPGAAAAMQAQQAAMQRHYTDQQCLLGSLWWGSYWPWP
jgi:hypothetical protein